MPTQQYQRLNAFGEPFRGSKIRGVQAKRYMGGPSQGALSTRPTYNAREEAEKEAMRQDRAEQEQAAARGQAAAGGTATQSPPAAPKRQGQLVPTVGGGSKWASGDELDRMDFKAKNTRKQARKQASYSGGMLGDVVRGVKSGIDTAVRLRKTQDRNYSRSRVASERKMGGFLTGQDAASYREKFRREGMLDSRQPDVEEALQ